MAQISLGTWKFIHNMGSLSHRGLIMTPGLKANKDNLGVSFSIFYKIMVCCMYSLELPQ